MPYPYSTLQEVQDEINEFIITNGARRISGSHMNDVLNGLAQFVSSSDVNLTGYLTTSSFNTFSSSYYASSASFKNIIENVFLSESKYLLTSSYLIDSASFLTKINNSFLSQSNYLLSASYLIDSSSFDSRIRSFVSGTDNYIGRITGSSIIVSNIYQSQSAIIIGSASSVNASTNVLFQVKGGAYVTDNSTFGNTLDVLSTLNAFRILSQVTPWTSTGAINQFFSYINTATTGATYLLNVEGTNSDNGGITSASVSIVRSNISPYATYITAINYDAVVAKPGSGITETAYQFLARPINNAAVNKYGFFQSGSGSINYFQGITGIGILPVSTSVYMLDVSGSARFSGRVQGDNAVSSNEFVTLDQLNSASFGTGSITGSAGDWYRIISGSTTVTAYSNGQVIITSGSTNSARLIVSGSGSFTGEVDAPSFNQTSLRVLKENILPFSASALDIIKTLDIVSYNYKNNKDSFKVGIIADDTHEYVSTKNRNVMDTTNSIGLLFKAIQEINEKIDALGK